jgi:hypothetical protein
MAGAGKRTFIAGEVLTAAQVNDYLMDQAVMRFSGSAARAASITAPSEGMVTYLDDANRLEIYDGSTWQQIPTDADDVRNIITASGQVLVGAGSSSLIAIAASLDGQVLTAASAQPGGYTFTTPATGADATYFSLAATGVTEMPNTLGAGFYKVSAGSITWNSSQFGFMDTDGVKYGFAVTSGVGLGTIPVTTASVFATTGTLPINLLVEEVSGVSDTLLTPLTISGVAWEGLSDLSFSHDAGPSAASIGAYQTNGSFVNLGPTSASAAAFVSASLDDNFGDLFRVAVVGIDSYNRVGLATPVATTEYPFAIYTANGTYTPPPWSSGSVDVLVVGGGGGSSGNAARTTPISVRASGGGGGGGASVFTGISTPASVAITVGAGGAAGPATAPLVGGTGNTSAFGSASVVGGGGSGGAAPVTAGVPGGSGGGGAAHYYSPPILSGATAAGGTGTAGLGYDGASGSVDTVAGTVWAGGGGGAGGAGGTPTIASTAGPGAVVWNYLYAPGGKGATGSPGGALSPAGGSGAPGIGTGPAPGVVGLAGQNGVVIVKALT